MSNWAKRLAAGIVAGALAAGSASAAEKPSKMGLGRQALPEEIAAWDTDVQPDGSGLPPGRGTVKQGEEIYLQRCASCHGEFGQGAGRWPTLAGGQGSLNADRPNKTIGSFWPQLAPLYDYIRRTMPWGNARSLTADETYAVVAGGGVENRRSLAGAVLWKDNHWALLGAGDLARALAAAPSGLPIVVEVEDDAQLVRALAAGVRHILVDNQPPLRVAAWVRRAGPDVTIQASGGITPETARAYAEAGAQLISIGALTHSAPAAPIRVDILPP